MSSKPIIELSDFHGLGLIIRFSSGVLYTNQVAEVGCLNPEVEGIFVPLPVKPGKSEIHSLQQHFRGSWRPIEEKDAQVVDSILRRNGHGYIRVDRARLKESFESWINVLIDPEVASEFTVCLHGFGKTNGILTWENSD